MGRKRKRDSDWDALATLLMESQGRFLTMARHYVGDRATAEDVVSEAFFRILDQGRTVDIRNVEAMTNTIITTVAIDVIRKRNTGRRKILLLAAGLNEVQSSAEEEVQKSRTAGSSISDPVILQCLDRLPDDQRLAFVLNAVDRWSTQRIGERLGVSQPTAWRLVNSARMALAAMPELEDHTYD
jgi:RNA polymerase sigma factor (sigma-70 family)